MTPPKVDEEYKDKIKDSIIVRAMMEFSTKGFFQTRMDDIVTKRLSKGTIYNYFNSKTDLFLATQERYRNAWTAATQIPVQTHKNATDSLIQYIKIIVKSYGDIPIEEKKASYETVGIAIHHEDKRIYESIKENEKKYIIITQEMIKKGKDSGEFKNNIDEEFMSGMIISFIQGMQLTSILMEKQYDWDKIGDLIAKWIVEEIKA